MKAPLGQWIEDNASLFRYSFDIKSMKSNAERVLLSGSVSSYLSGVLCTLYPDAVIVAVDDDRRILEDGRSECEDLVCICEPFDRYCEKDSYDIALSLLQIQSLDTRELTPYLYNLYDSLRIGGVLYLSFPDAVALTAMKKNLYPSWYSEDESVYMKYYMADDVMRALAMIGFEIRGVEGDDSPDLNHIVSLLCIKR